MYKTAALVLFGVALCANNYNSGFNCTMGSDLLCSQCNLDTSTCQLCSNGYVDPKYGNCKLPFRAIANCTSYKTYNMCQSCALGSDLQGRGVCTVSANSLSANSTCFSASAGTCRYCTDMRYIPDAQGNCGTLTCNVERCSLCSGADTCDMCVEDHTLVQGQCLESGANSALENCLIAEELDTCSRCKTGFFVSGGRCLSASSSIAAQMIRAGSDALSSGDYPAVKPTTGMLSR